MAIIVGMRRLIGNGVTHAIHDGVMELSAGRGCPATTACGIRFVGYDLPNESTESALRYTFRAVDSPDGIVMLRGAFEDRPVDCMSCLVGMRTWSQT